MNPISRNLGRHLLPAFLVVSLFACSKNNNDTPKPPTGNGIFAVFSAGNQWSPRSGMIFNDGKTVKFTDSTTMVYPKSLQISKTGDIYVSGCECDKYDATFNTYMTEGCHIVYWKNGVKKRLTEQPFNTPLYPYIYVTENKDVYVAASIPQTGFNKHVIVLWKNDQKQVITDGTYTTAVTGLKVQGTDVYIGGIEQNNGGAQVASLWKNGVKQQLGNGINNSYTSAIDVSGNNVYAAVVEGSNPRLLKNGVAQDFSPSISGRIDAIHVSGNDVYVLAQSGVINNAFAFAIWKNGQKIHDLQPVQEAFMNMSPQSVTEWNGDVYVSGTIRLTDQKAVGVIWKNGEIHERVVESRVVDGPSIFAK